MLDVLNHDLLIKSKKLIEMGENWLIIWFIFILFFRIKQESTENKEEKGDIFLELKQHTQLSEEVGSLY